MKMRARTDRIARVRAIQRRAAQAIAAGAAAEVARSDAQAAHLEALCRDVAPKTGVLVGANFASASECAMRLGMGRLSVVRHRVSLRAVETVARAELTAARVAERSADHIAGQARRRDEKAAEQKCIRQASVRRGALR